MNNLVLAYLGDAVYELYVREYLIGKGITKVKDLQKSATKYVSAIGQAEALISLLNKGLLTEEEIEMPIVIRINRLISRLTKKQLASKL